MKKKILIVLFIVVLMLSNILLVACSDKDDEQKKLENPKVVITMQNGKTIYIELYPEFAPKTVENFLGLVDDGYYDNTIFHRIKFDFMVQTGEFTLNEESEVVSKPSKRNIVGEFARNGFLQNTLSHTDGIISMARVAGETKQQDTEEFMNSASTQFFICTGDATHLDGVHAAFGKVIDKQSMDNVYDISRIPTGKFNAMLDFPINDNFSSDKVISSAIISSIRRKD